MTRDQYVGYLITQNTPAILIGCFHDESNNLLRKLSDKEVLDNIEVMANLKSDLMLRQGFLKPKTEFIQELVDSITQKYNNKFCVKFIHSNNKIIKIW